MATNIGVFIAEGCELCEALIVVDVLRRAKFDVTTISLTEYEEATSSNNVTFATDAIAADVDFAALDGIVLPGGMPGSDNLAVDETVNKIITEFTQQGKMVGAICAAPYVLGQANLLDCRTACCYPGFEDRLTGAKVSMDPVCVSGNVITSRGLGTAIDFALSIVEYFTSHDEAVALAAKFVYDYK